jgi:hypothetical protein
MTPRGIEKHFLFRYNFYNTKPIWESGMADEPLVLLLGNSIFIDSLAGSLQMRKTSKVIQSNAEAFEIKEIVSSINPDLIVYELGAQVANSMFMIASDYAEISQLAIDLAEMQVFWVHCRREQTESIQELCDCVSREISMKAQLRK